MAEDTGGDDDDHSQASTLKFYSSVGKDDDDDDEEEDAMARMAQPHLDQPCAKTGNVKEMIAEENESEEEKRGWDD